jgi:hypothetical protein
MSMSIMSMNPQKEKKKKKRNVELLSLSKSGKWFPWCRRIPTKVRLVSVPVWRD